MFGEINRLLKELQQGRISRRGFIRYATLLGLSLGAAEALAACAPSPTPKTTAIAGPTETATLIPSYIAGEDAEVPTPEWEPTPLPPMTPTPTATRLKATPTPVMWEPAMWACPSCAERFSTQEELVKHILAQHARKIPGARRVDKPTYAPYLTDKVARFDQRNTVFSRVMWDKDYQEQISKVTLRQRRETPEEMIKGRALVAGAIYVDDAVGSLVPNYRGYSGHVRGYGGLYDWDDAVSPERLPVEDTSAMAEHIKAVARFYGADLVGICAINPLWVYSHYYDRETGAYGELEIPYKYAIVMGLEMDFASIRKSPGFPASAATALIYSKMAEVSSKLAKYIRALGYEAVPSGNDTTQNIPLAIDAGLGEIGRLGLLLTPEFGPRQRLCKVLTNLPLATDKPIDFGMQRFCETCLFCAHACPAKAIPFGERSLEQTSISNRPGILRWTVNVGNCYLFWRSNGGTDCSNCIAACPWAQQNRPWL
ncbi:MAG: reductive dehalogenase [Chloroflexi bacterium]|nr:reductive dehalogenase [Chloroflexota bacterium]